MYLVLVMGEPRKFRRCVCVCVGGGPNNVFTSQRIAQRAVRTSFEKQLDPMTLIASLGWMYLYF